MDDPDVAWPYWKFGLKKEDLFTKLHDQYNTVSSSIQDPEAFHHDVYEISHDAVSAEDFYRRMADRKAQRLRELNDSLESASLEIIANPSLIGTEQWHYALQLFRSMSLDSLVRFFASYLPEDHPWHRSDASSSVGSLSETSSTVDSVAHSHTSFFDDVDDKPIMTDEPLSLSSCTPAQLPPSPRSMTMRSDELAPVATDADAAHHKYVMSNLTPARTLSFSGSESDAFGLLDSRGALHDDVDDDTSQPSDPETPTSSIADLSDEGETLDHVVISSSGEAHYDEEFVTTQLSAEIMESETPTPKPQLQAATSFFDAKPLAPHRRHRSLSPSRPHPLSQSQTLSCGPLHKSSRPPLLRRRECSPSQGRRRSPREVANRIQKALPDPVRVRPRGRRRVDC